MTTVSLPGTPSTPSDRIAVDFVDVLFALVVGEILSPLRDPDLIRPLGALQLVVAAVLTLLSWLGYHASTSRGNSAVVVFNRGFWQFLLDILMVMAYWIASVSYEKNLRMADGLIAPNDKSWWRFNAPSIWPEGLAVVASFGLYVVWDQLAKRNHQQITEIDGRRPRRAATLAGLLLALVVVGATGALLATELNATLVVAGADVCLIVLLIGYRWAKEHPGPLKKVRWSWV